jgi:hypothetical protein
MPPLRRKLAPYAAISLALSLWGTEPARAATPPAACPDTIAQAPSDTTDPSAILLATAVIHQAPPATRIAIWRAADGRWQAGQSGSLLVPGDAVCLLPQSAPAFLRGLEGNPETLTEVRAGLAPLTIPGSAGRAPNPAERAWLATLEWPSVGEVAALERTLRTTSRSTRTGATRGMSIGSTPRAIYLEGAAGLPKGSRQVLSPGLTAYMWGFCGVGLTGVVEGAPQPGTLTPWQPVAGAALNGASKVTFGSGGPDAKSYAIAWTDFAKLPKPPWLKRPDRSMSYALWLAVHDSGEYVWLAHSLLADITASPAAYHYLAYQAGQCLGAPPYRPWSVSAKTPS